MKADFYKWSNGLYLNRLQVASVLFPGVLGEAVTISMSDGRSYQRVFNRIEELTAFEEWLGLQ